MRKAQPAACVAVACIGFLADCGGGNDDAPAASTADTVANQRAAAMLAQMTPDEKIQMVHAISLGVGPLCGAGYIPGIPRLAIPDSYIADSATGVAQIKLGATGLDPVSNGATAMPAPIGLAASWDPQRANAYGAQISTELRTIGFTEGLGGGVDLARQPRPPAMPPRNASPSSRWCC